jgi:hypothetical protein
VAGIDCLKNEALFSRRKHTFAKAGFQHEAYWESRFLVVSDYDPRRIIEAFNREFNLTPHEEVHYHDQYFDTTLRPYSGRKPKMRLRSRDRRKNETDDAIFGTDPATVTSFQITYTRAREDKRRIDQCRYFPTRKDKFSALLQPGASLDDIPEPAQATVRKHLYSPDVTGTVDFHRTTATNQELALCTDRVAIERPFYVIELKVWNDMKLLQEAMRYLMVECPVAVMQTTHGKSDVFCS